MIRARKLLPIGAVVAFVVMIAIGETQIRSSSNWPPPPQHELGGWVIENPRVLDWAAGLNLPASVPIVWMWAHIDSFEYAIDDHRLIVYLPWILFVYSLWYFLGYRLDRFVAREKVRLNNYFVLGGQIFITLELLYVARGINAGATRIGGPTELFCFWAWALLAIVGWVDLIVQRSTRHRERPSESL